MTDNPKTHGKQFLFSLVRLRPECRIQPTYVDFEPLFLSSGPAGNIIPIFNDDRCHFTSAFLLPSEKKARTEGIETQKMRFKHRVRQSISSSESSKMDDPSPSSKYCQICREYFKNYDQHLELKGHVLRWHHNEFNQDIQHLCQKVNAIDTPAHPSKKSKPIQKKQKNDCHGHGRQNSPKTKVDKYPKRKMSSSNQDGSLNQTLTEEPFQVSK